MEKEVVRPQLGRLHSTLYIPTTISSIACSRVRAESCSQGYP